MRFNKRNWIRFFDGSNKKTTIRLRKSKIGHHKAYAGSYYNPVVLGEFDIAKVEERGFGTLTKQDARDDGFDTLEQLKTELVNLNGHIDDDTFVYQHWIDNVKATADNSRTIQSAKKKCKVESCNIVVFKKSYCLGHQYLAD